MNKFSIFATAALLSLTLMPETGSAQLFSRLGARYCCPPQQCCPPSCFQPSDCYQQPMVYQHHVGPACGCQPMQGCLQHGIPSCGCFQGEEEIKDCIDSNCSNCYGLERLHCERVCRLMYDDNPLTNPLFLPDCFGSVSGFDSLYDPCRPCAPRCRQRCRLFRR